MYTESKQWHSVGAVTMNPTRWTRLDVSGIFTVWFFILFFFGFCCCWFSVSRIYSAAIIGDNWRVKLIPVPFQINRFAQVRLTFPYINSITEMVRVHTKRSSVWKHQGKSNVEINLLHKVLLSGVVTRWLPSERWQVHLFVTNGNTNKDDTTAGHDGSWYHFSLDDRKKGPNPVRHSTSGRETILEKARRKLLPP